MPYLSLDHMLYFKCTVNTLTVKGCVTMPFPQQNKEYTIDDIYALPDGQRAELIDGAAYAQASADTPVSQP